MFDEYLSHLENIVTTHKYIIVDINGNRIIMKKVDKLGTMTYSENMFHLYQC